MQLHFQVSMPRNSKKTCKNGSRSNKIHQNGPKCSPIEKISPQEPKRSQKGSIKKNFWEPPGHQKSAKIEKKGSRKSMIFSTPSWNRLCLILGFPRHPQSSQNETKIDPRAAQTHFRPNCIVCRPLPMKNTLFASPESSKIIKNHAKMQAKHELQKRKASKVDF